MTKTEQAVWIAHSLFERGRVSGASANLSFADGERILITRSGSCFGTLTAADFSVLDREGTLLEGRPASKEWPLHLMLYAHLPQCEAVIHTHSPYATLWSCLEEAQGSTPWPLYTPYLRMRLGNVGRIPYAEPGTQRLFDQARKSLNGARGYLLAHHGPIVAAKDLMAAFCDLEEMEESARTAWLLRGSGAKTI